MMIARERMKEKRMALGQRRRVSRTVISRSFRMASWVATASTEMSLFVVVVVAGTCCCFSPLSAMMTALHHSLEKACITKRWAFFFFLCKEQTSVSSED
jgi:hypothetical protein